MKLGTALSFPMLRFYAEYLRHAQRTSAVTKEEMMDCYQFGTVPAASVDTHPKGRDAKQGSVGTMGSAVPEGQAPKGHP